MFSFAESAIFVWYYGYGDMFMYMDVGGRAAAMVRRDPYLFGQLLGACFGIEPSRTLGIVDTSTTGNMQAIVGVFRLLHESIWAVGFWIGLLSFTAQAFAYVGAIRFVGDRYERYVRFAFLYTPSVAFWSSAITKEAVAIAGLSLFMYGLASLGPRRIASVAVLATFGVFLMLAAKPYLLIPLGIGLAAYGLRRRRRDVTKKPSGLVRVLRPVAYMAIAFSAIIVPGYVFPSLRPDKVVETANLRRSVAYGVGGSDLQRIDESGADSSSVSLVYVPVGLTAALFRPFFFEARNFTQLLNIFETTGILVLVLRMIFRVGIRGIVRKVLDTPELTFCMVFTLMTALAVGMSNPNLGTISRYRAPMMPFYVLAILILNESTQRAKARGALAPATAPIRTLVPPRPRTVAPPAPAGASAATTTPPSDA